jgi:F0F1-type ATP synthase membrane subunit b/b'
MSLERLALGGHREEVEDAAAVVVDQDDRERQVRPTICEQAADIMRERDERQRALSREMADLALRAAAGVLGESVDDERNRALVEDFLAREDER